MSSAAVQRPDPNGTPLLYLIRADGAPAESWPLGEKPLVVGRGDVAEACVSDGALSRSHFMIVREGPDFFVVDLDSQNGTWMDDARITGRKLRSGEVIRAGQSIFYFSAARLPLHSRPVPMLLPTLPGAIDLVPITQPAQSISSPSPVA